MAITSNVSIIHVMSGDEQWQVEYSNAANAASPAQNEIRTLVISNNTITPPAGGTTPKSVTIMPPSGNTATITLKGVNGDTGVVLHLTNPALISLNSPTATFVLTCSAQVAGVRFIWS
jgi:hypothetical protein